MAIFSQIQHVIYLGFVGPCIFTHSIELTN